MFRHSRLSFAVAMALVGVTGAPLAVAQEQGEPKMLDALNVTATRSATKTDTPVIETPQSVSVVSREDWEEKGARTVQRAASYTPGVGTNQVGSSNRYDYLILRGFSDGSINNTYLDGLRVMNDGGSYSSFAIDPWFLERIEIVKGPTSVLYGQGSPGGIVALTSKRPEFRDGGEIRVSLGNNAQRSFAFDVTGPVDDEQRVAYRVTGIASAADAQQDHVELDRRAIAPSLTWDMTGGQMGYNSLGNIFFYGTGMYVAAIVAIALVYDVGEYTGAAGGGRYDFTPAQYFTGFILGSLAAGVFCAISAFIIGYITFGLRGPYFAIGTLGVAIAAGELVSNWDWVGGGQGVTLPVYPGDLDDGKVFIYFAFAITGVVLFTFLNSPKAFASIC